MFDGNLHLAAAKGSKVATTLGRATIGVLGGQIFECRLPGHDLVAVAWKGTSCEVRFVRIIPEHVKYGIRTRSPKIRAH